MANKIILKKSAVNAKVPLPGDLDFGELAINYQDGSLYYKDAGGIVRNIVEAPPTGSGSGADADLLDGIDSFQFLRSDTTDQYTTGTLSFNDGTTTEFLNTGVGRLEATISTGTALVTVADTTGLVAGQILTKISGVGQFGAAATILSVDTGTTFTASLSHTVAGDIVFSAGVSPFDVVSSVVVTNLNSDFLDGRDSTYFYSPDNPPPAGDELDTLQLVTERGATTDVATISFTAGTVSTSTGTGTVVVTGGVGVSGDIYAGSIQDTPIGSTTANTGAFTTLTASGNVTFNGSDAVISLAPVGTLGTVTINPILAGNIDNMIIGATARGTGAFTTLTANDVTTITDTTTSTTTGTGALVVSGGVGITENLNVGGNFGAAGSITTTNTTSSTTTGTGSIVAAGGVGIAQNLNVGGNFGIAGTVSVSNATSSINTTTGALTVVGGVGIGQNLHVGGTADIGGDLTITGNFTVNGTTTTINTSTLTVTDLNITVAQGAPTALAANGAGLIVDGPAAASMLYAEVDDSWNFNKIVKASSIQATPIGSTTASTGAFTTLTASGVTTITNATASTSVDTGALQVDGGVGINGAVYAGSLQDTPVGSVTANTGAFTTLSATGAITANTTTNSQSYTTTGAGTITIASGTTGSIDNMSVGATTRSTGAFTTLSASSTVTFDMANASISLQPTGSGTITANPATTGSINNMSVGATTRSTGSFTTLTANGITTITNTTASTTADTGALQVDGGVGINGNLNVGGNAVVTGTVSHTGLVPTAGTQIDQIASLTRSLTITTDWSDVGISGADLATGTYIVQLFANDAGAGGTSVNEYYSGTMSWYSGPTSTSVSLPTDEIALHRAGASSDAGLYLRTFRVDGGTLKLQIYSNLDNSSATNYVFKFRRMI